MSGWPSGLRRCVQVAVHFCGRGFESHFWQNIFFPNLDFALNKNLWWHFVWSYSYGSRVAQWKRAGPITQRSVDRNYALLSFFFSKPELFIYAWLKITFATYFKPQFFNSKVILSGWPSGLRRQTQGTCLTPMIRSCKENSGPRMRAWVQIPLLTAIFLVSLFNIHVEKMFWESNRPIRIVLLTERLF